MRVINKRNIAMIYVVAPKGQGCRGPTKGRGPSLPEDEFLQNITNLGKRAISTIEAYNDLASLAGLSSISAGL